VRDASERAAHAIRVEGYGHGGTCIG